MFHVGLDIHSTRISICVLSQTGQVVHRSQARGTEEMLRTLKDLTDRFEVCYEASCGYGHYHDLLRPLAPCVLVADPGQLRLIFRSKAKNDRNDAERLAKLLYLGETPSVHVPAADVRMWRELINCPSQVVAKRTRAKNAARALLRSAGVVPPKHPDQWTKAGLVWLRRLDLALTRQVRRIELELNRQARRSPAVSRLRTIPGVGPRTAEAVDPSWMSDRRSQRELDLTRYGSRLCREKAKCLNWPAADAAAHARLPPAVPSRRRRLEGPGLCRLGRFRDPPWARRGRQEPGGVEDERQLGADVDERRQQRAEQPERREADPDPVYRERAREVEEDDAPAAAGDPQRLDQPA
jgi:transposase